MKNTFPAIVLCLAPATCLLLTGCQSPNVHQFQSSWRERILDSASTDPNQADSPAGSSRERTTWPAAPIGLDEAVHLALTNNPGLKNARLDVLIQDDQIAVARSAFLPQAGVGGSYYFLKDDIRIEDATFLDSQFWQAELSLQWLLWDFGKTQGRFDQARFARDHAAKRYQRAREQLIIQVAQAYYAILRAQKAERIASDALYSARLQQETAQQLFEQQLVARDDVLRSEVQAAHYEQTLLVARNSQKIAISQLNRLMGIHVNWPTEVRDSEGRPDWDNDLTGALQLAVENRSELEQVQLAIAGQQAARMAVQADYFPQLTVSQSFIHIEDSGRLSEDAAMSSIGIQIPLFAGGRRPAQVRQADRRIEQAMEQAREICDLIAFEVKQALLGLEDADARLAVAEQVIASAQESRRLTMEKYRNHLATATEVADAESSYTQAQQNYYAALYDLKYAVEQLRFAMGTNDSNGRSRPAPSQSNRAADSAESVAVHTPHPEE